jgi:hypothetical protein
MSLPYRQEQRLHRIGTALRRSDPHLAGMLAVFGRVCAGETMPSAEQLRTRLCRLWQVLAWLVAAIAIAAADAAHVLALAARTCMRAIRVAWDYPRHWRSRRLARSPYLVSTAAATSDGRRPGDGLAAPSPQRGGAQDSPERQPGLG